MRLEADQCCNLQCDVESESDLIGDQWIMPILVWPLFENQAGRPLEDEGPAEMKDVQCSVRAPGKFLGEILGDDRVAEDGARSDRRDD